MDFQVQGVLSISLRKSNRSKAEDKCPGQIPIVTVFCLGSEGWSEETVAQKTLSALVPRCFPGTEEGGAGYRVGEAGARTSVLLRVHQHFTFKMRNLIASQDTHTCSADGGGEGC